MTLLSSLKSRRRPTRRRGCGLRLEPLEARQLLTPYYVSGASGLCPGSGTELEPWCSIGVLNGEIATPGKIMPGDVINFRRGETFTGNVLFDSVGGTPTAPITIQPYGPGGPGLRPKINAGSGSGITVRNKAGFDISGLEIFGNYLPDDSGSTQEGNGIEFLSDLCSAPALTYIRLHDLDIHHFGNHDVRPLMCDGFGRPDNGSGIYFFGVLPATGPNPVHFRDIRVENVDVHHNEIAGLAFGDSWDGFGTPPLPSHEKVYVGRMDAYNQKPHIDKLPIPAGGSGIVLHAVRSAVVEHSRAYSNGREGTDVLGVGFKTYNSDRVLLQYNESYANRGYTDEEGFAIDPYTTNSLIQYNYAHDNSGAGFMLGAVGASDLVASHNVLRYNVSEKDSRHSEGGGIRFENWQASDVDVYGNTVYMSPNGFAQEPNPPAIRFSNPFPPPPTCVTAECSPRLNIYNNVFYVSHSTLPVFRLDPQFVPVSAYVVVKGNAYFNKDGPITIKWGTANYDLAGFQNCMTGPCRERHNSQPVGTDMDPKLASIGKAGTIPEEDFLTMWTTHLVDFYKVTMDTPQQVRTGGMNLFSAQFGLQWDPQGYWLANWPTSWRPAQDPFGVELPDVGNWSIGVSQALS